MERVGAMQSRAWEVEAVRRVDAWPYALPLRHPLSLDGTPHHERRGWLVRVTLADGATGWGDVAPLPGFSDESHDEAGRAVRELGEAFSQGAGGRHISAVPDIESLPASVRFGWESALLDAAARSQRTTTAHILADRPHQVVFLNALVVGDERALEAFAGQGYRAVKMKVGRQSVEDDAARVRRLVDAVDPSVAVRLDANRAWTEAEARRFAEAVPVERLAYIEEPLREPRGLEALAEQTGLPIALDETVRELRPTDLSGWSFARAVVLKPTLLGGIRRTLEWGAAAQPLGIDNVVSACFESGVGLRALVALAATLGPAPVPAGLDTYRWVADDVLRPRLPIEGACVDVAEVLSRAYEVVPTGGA